MRLLIWSKSWWMSSYWQPHFRLKRNCSIIFSRSALRIYKLFSCPHCRPSSVSLRCITTCSNPAVRWAAVPPGAVTAVPGLVRECAVQLRVAARQAVLVPSAGRPQWLWGRLRQHRRSRGHQVIFYCECFWETFILFQQF